MGHLDARRRAGAVRSGQHPAAGVARPDHPDQRRRAGHGRGARPRAAGNSSPPDRRSGPGTWRSACRPASPTGPATISVSARRTTRNGSSGSRGTSAPRLDSLFMVPRTMTVRAVPKGAVLQVRNVLTNLVDITGRPTVPLLDLLLEQGRRSRRVDQADGDQGRPADAGRPRLAAARGDRRRRLRRAPPARRVPVLPAQHLRVPAGGAAAPAALLLDQLEPAHPRRRRRAPDRRPGAERPVPGMPGRDFSGMASRYLHALREGDRLNVFHDSADGFHLQEDLTKPMIFVSAGTGFAPMRAFLGERLASQARGRRTGRSRAVQRHPLDQPRLHLPRRDRAVRRRGSARPRPRRGVARHARAAAIMSRTGSGSRARLSGACSTPAATSTSAARSRCAPPFAPPSPTSSPNTGRCRASRQRPTSRSWRPPHATAPTCGADPSETAWTSSPCC